MKAEIRELSFAMDGTQILSFRTEDDCRELYEKYKGKALTITVKRFSQPRSTNANAYAWVLMDKLAEKLHIAKESIYKNYVRNIGGNNDRLYIADEAVGRFCTAWEGSSTYDTAQMSRLIDLIVQDCMSVGIEVRDPADIESMLEACDGR